MAVRVRSGLVAVAVVALATACGGDGGGDDGSAAPEPGDATTSPAPEPLEVLVTNDDGVGAEGIDVLVTALGEVDGVELTVVAPASQQSGTGGNVTEGPVATRAAATAGGHEATAVEGFPADAVRVALDDMGLRPDLVISGINEGQNLGGIVEASGTVGAARAAVQRGVPALAVSQGIAGDLDYEVAADLVVAWLEDNRDAVVAGDTPAGTVVNLNVPSCDAGELRGTLDVATAATTEGALGMPSDCTSTAEGFTDDITAFQNGYATLAEVPAEPAA